jgi:hypothetical protein
LRAPNQIIEIVLATQPSNPFSCNSRQSSAGAAYEDRSRGLFFRDLGEDRVQRLKHGNEISNFKFQIENEKWRPNS